MSDNKESQNKMIVYVERMEENKPSVRDEKCPNYQYEDNKFSNNNRLSYNSIMLDQYEEYGMDKEDFKQNLELEYTEDNEIKSFSLNSKSNGKLFYCDRIDTILSLYELNRELFDKEIVKIKNNIIDIIKNVFIEFDEFQVLKINGNIYVIGKIAEHFGDLKNMRTMPNERKNILRNNLKLSLLLNEERCKLLEISEEITKDANYESISFIQIGSKRSYIFDRIQSAPEDDFQSNTVGCRFGAAWSHGDSSDHYDAVKIDVVHEDIYEINAFEDYQTICRIFSIISRLTSILSESYSGNANIYPEYVNSKKSEKRRMIDRVLKKSKEQLLRKYDDIDRELVELTALNKIRMKNQMANNHDRLGKELKGISVNDVRAEFSCGLRKRKEIMHKEKNKLYGIICEIEVRLEFYNKEDESLFEDMGVKKRERVDTNVLYLKKFKPNDFIISTEFLKHNLMKYFKLKLKEKKNGKLELTHRYKNYPNFYKESLRETDESKFLNIDPDLNDKNAKAYSNYDDPDE